MSAPCTVVSLSCTIGSFGDLDHARLDDVEGVTLATLSYNVRSFAKSALSLINKPLIRKRGKNLKAYEARNHLFESIRELQKLVVIDGDKEWHSSEKFESFFQLLQPGAEHDGLEHGPFQAPHLAVLDSCKIKVNDWSNKGVDLL